jgi:hypothetical protein
MDKLDDVEVQCSKNGQAFIWSARYRDAEIIVRCQFDPERGAIATACSSRMELMPR